MRAYELMVIFDGDLDDSAAAQASTRVAGTTVELGTSIEKNDWWGRRKFACEIDHKIEGYDLGNSPAEFGSERVEGLGLVMNTTNGTRALLAAEAAGAARIVVCAGVNLEAVADRLRGVDHVVIVCAGRDGGFALEDAVCAGLLAERWTEDPIELNESARASVALAKTFTLDASFLATTEAGRLTEAAGLSSDLEDCAALDRYAVVPEMTDRVIRAR